MEMVKPSTAGFCEARLQHIDTAMQRFIDSGKVAGIATMVAHGGQIVHEAGYGLASHTPKKTVQPDTLFRMWSVTKAITAVAVLTLYEQGYFVLDQDVADFLPEFKDTPVHVSGEGDSMVVEPRKSAITVRQCMTHSAGISSGLSGVHPIEKMMSACTQQLFQESATLETAVKRIAQVPLLFQPFTGWHYSHGLEVMARLVEVVSGQSYPDYLQAHIFGPLGMKDSGYHVSDAQLERFSSLYAWDDAGQLQEVETPADSPHYVPDGSDPGPRWYAGGFGLISTPQDLLRFGQMLLNEGELDGERILAPRTVALMAANHLPADLLPYHFPDSPPRYGYGHGLGVHVLMDHGLAGLPCKNGEYWKDGGAGTIFWVDPGCDLVGVAMYQLLDFWRVKIFDTFRATVYQAME